MKTHLESMEQEVVAVKVVNLVKEVKVVLVVTVVNRVILMKSSKGLLSIFRIIENRY